jgi:hypothetical protein
LLFVYFGYFFNYRSSAHLRTTFSQCVSYMFFSKKLIRSLCAALPKTWLFTN